MTTTAALLAEAKRLDAAATKGPWTASEYLDDGRIGILTDSNGIVVALRSGVATKQDAAFIARSRTLLPQLADALEAEEAERIRQQEGWSKTFAEASQRGMDLADKVVALEARLAKVLTAIDNARQSCRRCEGSGRLWADGQVHYQSESRPTIA